MVIIVNALPTHNKNSKVTIFTLLFLFIAFPLFSNAQAPASVAGDADSAATSTENTAQSSGRPDAADVYEVQQLTEDQNFGDFVVGPGKFDVSLAPGDSEVVTITVTNRTGSRKLFRLSTEDMVGSQDVEAPTVLLGEDRGPYTLKDYLSVPANEFYIDSGQKVVVPITVTLPTDVEPGGHYGSLLVQTTVNERSQNSGGGTAVVSRIAVLFFVTTPGELDQSGSFIDFQTIPNKRYFSTGPISFGMLYENTGTVHTTPVGEIVVENTLGQIVGVIEVLPWFSLPQSLRLREVTWDKTALLGRYTATASVYPGFGSTTELQERSVTFWVVDWKIIVTGVLLLLGVVVLLRFLFTKVKISFRD